MTPPCTWPSTISGLTCTPQSSTATYCSTSTCAGLGVDLDRADVRAERPREVRRVVGDVGLEVGLETVGQVVRGERLEGDGGQRHRLVGRALAP